MRDYPEVIFATTRTDDLGLWWEDDDEGGIKYVRADTIDHLQAELAALRDFYNAAVADGMSDDPDGSDDESVGWNGDGSEMAMTYGHIRRVISIRQQDAE